MSNILFLINNLRKGGAEKILTNISNYASNKSYNVTICIFKDGVHYNLNNNVNVIRLNVFRELFRFFNSFKKVIAKNSSKKKIVISNLNFSNYFNIILSFFTKHKPVIVLHFSLNYYTYSSKLNKYLMFPLHYTLQYILYGFSYKVISVSYDIKTYYKENMKLDSQLIYNPSFYIDHKIKSKFNPLDKNKINIIQVGSFINIKNHIELLNCLNKYLFKFCIQNNIQFTFIGDGPLKKNLRKYVIDNNIDKLVTFIGLVDNVDEYYYNCDFLISTSKLEGLPTVLIEAISHNKPVVSTFQRSAYEIMSNDKQEYNKNKIKINDEFINLKTGLMYKQGNLEQLSNSIKYMCNNMQKFKFSNSTKINILSKFDIKNFEKYEEINN